ncbi:MAG: twin-arginine translocation signal domain-containing protein, partial [Paludibacter sp.]
MKRRDFIRTTAVGAGMIALNNHSKVFSQPSYQLKENKLPRWRGFNILDFFSPQRYVASAQPFAETEQDFKWMADWGFDFVRIPMAYPSYLKYNPASGRDITPEETVDFR